jgi:ADP-ribose pyrophosphatase
VSDGGGVGGEDIVVRRVPIAEVTDFIAERRAAGLAMDVKLLILLGAGMLAG